eukprot:584928-Rhodomonas_salina.1
MGFSRQLTSSEILVQSALGLSMLGSVRFYACAKSSAAGARWYQHTPYNAALNDAAKSNTSKHKLSTIGTRNVVSCI